MEWGPQLEHLQRIEATQGFTPPALLSMPELDPFEQDFWDAYSMLDQARVWGQGFPQPITMLEIKAFAELRGYEGEDLVDLITFVQDLDRAYIKRLADRKKGQGENAGT